MSEKKSLKDWWSERSRNQKYIIIGGLILVAILASRNNNNNYYSEENTTSTYSPNTESSICSYCGKSYTGSGYNDALGMGRSYCSGFCYVDAN
jgi:hypothetical protein